MIILGIETSCDETSAALVQDGRHVLTQIIASSAKELAEYGGVFPEVAARRQVECMIPVLERALTPSPSPHCGAERGVFSIAVTRGPGLLTSLLVGTTTARMLASAWHVPLIGVHHTLGHLSSTWLLPHECHADDMPAFPLLTLSVSGGHTDLWLRESHTKNTLIGRTRDDAAGEAFDKGATLLGLPYPGGPVLARLAEGGNPHFVEFPRPLHNEETCDFSFSGLKTSLKYAIRDRGGIEALSEIEKKDIAASFQEAICNHLVSGLEQALERHHQALEIHIVGGVSANKRLRSMCAERGIKIRLPQKLEYCTDNAAMIAAAGYFLYKEKGDAAFAEFTTEASVALDASM